MQKILSLKKPNLGEAKNWIAEQQFYREKKLVCRKAILHKKKKTQNSWPYNTRRNKKT